jgi:diguanylate cyclase (GGDEF)-like protein
MKVLVAEDDAVSRRSLEVTLAKWDYVVVSVRDGVAAWNELQRPDGPNLAVLDWMMPGMDGIEVCRQIRKRAKEPYTYVVLLTGRTRKEDVVAGLDAGADDYVAKPFDFQELRVRLHTGERILHLQEQLIAARENLRHQATHDALTGFWNRAAILGLLSNELARAQRAREPLSVAMADLDHFKSINDRFGHQAGDAVLHQAARRIHATMRPYDFVGRYGGEEFLMILPGCDVQDAAAVAERHRLTMARDLVDTRAGSIRVTVSIGVASFDPANPVDAEILLRAADNALYQAKAAGRNRVSQATVSEEIPQKLSA